MSEIDPTISERMKRWRGKAAAAGESRLELRVNEDDRDAVRQFAAARSTKRKALADSRTLHRILQTINAPRPTAIDEVTLLECLLGDNRQERWYPHIEALLTEVSVEALHDLVLERVVDFEDLRRAGILWRVKGPNDEWIKEMADLTLVRGVA